MPFVATGSNEPPRGAKRAARRKLRQAFRKLAARPGISRRQRRAGLFRALKERPVDRPLPQRRAARQPHRISQAAGRRAGDDGGGSDDPDPPRPLLAAAFPEIRTPNAPSGATGRVRS